jgi:hypothetical protein
VSDTSKPTQAEEQRLEESRTRKKHWKRWGPYLSERAWGTVRENYSSNGTAWEYFPHDHARSRAYRWNEDGLAGICDRRQNLCFALSLWNGNDSILKERLFGLTGSEGNHGEDVKEYYFYLDNTPTHSYMKFLYKYPHAAYPYSELVEENRMRDKTQPEYELMDTGIFDENRYFDAVVEYAKAGIEDILIRITMTNRGPDAADLHLLPTLWFRNTWSWSENGQRPKLCNTTDESGRRTIESHHAEIGTYWLHCEGDPQLLFTENDTNVRRLYGSSAPGYKKDGINDYVVTGCNDAVNPERRGTKAAAHYRAMVAPGESFIVKLRLTNDAQVVHLFGRSFDTVFRRRIQEANDFYGTIIPSQLPDDAKNVMRQSLSGLLWSKQFYHYVVRDWLKGDPGQPQPPTERQDGRNSQWNHVFNADVLSMPDKWEYPGRRVWERLRLAERSATSRVPPASTRSSLGRY